MKTTVRSKTFLCLILCAVIFLGAVSQIKVDVVADTTLEQDLAKQAELSKQLSNLKSKSAQLKKDIAAAKSKQASQAVIKTNLENQIACLEEEIDTSERLIGSYEELIKIKETRKLALQLQIETNYANFKKTLRYNYMYGQYTDFELLFSAKSLFEFLSDEEYSEKIFNYDKTLLANLAADTEELAEVTDKLSEMLASAQLYRDETAATQAELDAAKAEVEQLIAELERDAAKKTAYYNEVDDAINDMNGEIQALLKQIAKKKTYVGGSMCFPIPVSAYSRVSSYYGYRTHPVTGKKNSFHTGIDLPAAKNTKIYAANDGEVILAKYYGGYGNCVMIDHGGGIVTVYGHCNSLAVKVGQNVKRGQVIAYVGTTGSSTGNHLHFEVRVNGSHVDPIKNKYIVLP